MSHTALLLLDTLGRRLLLWGFFCGWLVGGRFFLGASFLGLRLLCGFRAAGVSHFLCSDLLGSRFLSGRLGVVGAYLDDL